MKLLTVAGELSGDAHGGELLGELRRELPQLEIHGIGGPRMLKAGLTPLRPMSHLQVHGLLEVVGHLPRLYKLLWELEAWLKAEQPDVVLTIDYPGFNLKLAAAARRLGIPTIHYSSPQIWAWRGGRIKKIVRAIDLMIVLFPFELPLYEQAGMQAAFLGHPLVGAQASKAEVDQLRAKLHLNAGRPLVGIMPGSRPSELARNLPTLLEGVALAGKEGFEADYVLPLAPSLDAAQVEAMVAASGVPVQVVENAFLPLLQVADMGLVASGTATLQAAMAGLPFVVVYRVAPLTYFLARRLAYVKHFALANILAGREVAPELLQENFTPQAVRDHMLRLANDPQARETMRQTLLKVTSTLGEPGAYGRAATLIAGKLRKASSSKKQK